MVSRMKEATQPDAIRCQVVRSCGSTGGKGREVEGLGWLGAGGDDLVLLLWLGASVL